jgi:hypothetical protein
MNVESELRHVMQGGTRRLGTPPLMDGGVYQDQSISTFLAIQHIHCQPGESK